MHIKRPATLFLSFFLSGVFLFSQGERQTKYRWPLNINNGYSSSFQEFRSNHFHGGIDFRTYQKTGYPVFAISDGKIYAIRMVKRGSGRGLFLKHLDGYTSIYFHLDRFANKIENQLKAVQKKKKIKIRWKLLSFQTHSCKTGRYYRLFR
jgi:hypothetical protein